MLNLSDLKPATFLIDTAMRFLWNPDAMIKLGPDAAQAAAIDNWSQRFYGGGSSSSDRAGVEGSFGPRGAAITKAYFAVDYILAADTTAASPQRYGDEHLSGLVRKLLTGEESAADAAAWVAHPLGAQLRPLHASAMKLHDDMVVAHADGASFFQSSFLLYVATHRYGCEAINSTAHAMLLLAKDGGDVTDDVTGDEADSDRSSDSSHAFIGQQHDFLALPTAKADAAHRHLSDALGALDSLRALQREAEQLKWRGFYAGGMLVATIHYTLHYTHHTHYATHLCRRHAGRLRQPRLPAAGCSPPAGRSSRAWEPVGLRGWNKRTFGATAGTSEVQPRQWLPVATRHRSLE
jgi:hypothetical protein